MGKRNPKRGVKLVFDPEERKEFLTGFRKRKIERKVKAQEKMEKAVKAEVTAMKEQHKEQMAQMYSFDKALPEVEHLIEPIEVHDLDDHVVTISGMDTEAMAFEAGLGLGRNTIDQEENEEEQDDHLPSTAPTEVKLKGLSVKSVKKGLNNQVVKAMKKTLKKNKLVTEGKKKGNKSKRRLERKKKQTGKRKNRPNSRPQR